MNHYDGLLWLELNLKETIMIEWTLRVKEL